MTIISRARWPLVAVLAALTGVLAALFWKSFLPGSALYATDTPLSFLTSQARRLPQGLTGEWADLNTLGYWDGCPPPNVTTAMLLVLGPVGYARFETPLSLLLLGLCAWYFFRQLGLMPLICLLGALAATLNSTFFSAACWGVGNQTVAVAMNFLALAVLADQRPGHRWLRLPLAGVAVGLGVTEGADIGAIFSLFAGAFFLFQAGLESGFQLRALARGFLRLCIVAFFAGLIAAQALFGLINTQIRGIGVIEEGRSSNRTRWEWATQYSLPKLEALGIAVPGMFGYRMDAPAGAAYWGAGGRHPALDEWFANGLKGPRPPGMLRYSGGGNYVGVLVLIGGLWAVLECSRRREPALVRVGSNSPTADVGTCRVPDESRFAEPQTSIQSSFSQPERYFIWFWAGTAVLSLLLAFGRFAPFYRLFYLLPYASTIRSPGKFLWVCEWALVILFAYGLEGLWRQWMQSATDAGGQRSRTAQDRAWLKGSVAAVEISLLCWGIYALSRPNLETWLKMVDFKAVEAAAIARFSVRQVGWFVLFLSLTLGLVALILRGELRGRRQLWGGALLGLLLVLDLGRANLPWIYYWDYPAKIASNPVIDFLRDRPYEHRVVTWLIPDTPELDLFNQLYRLEWIQHHYPYYNIQTLDIFQLTRKPTDLAAFEQATEKDLARRWQLTNTRYLLGAAAQVDLFNRSLAPSNGSFRILDRFEIGLKPGITSATRCEDLAIWPNKVGQCALMEFTGALPRARLYSRWEVKTNEPAALARLMDRAFDPTQTVLVERQLAVGPATPEQKPEDSQVVFTSYQPKHVVLEAQAQAPSVLLLNDRFDPNWKVFVDGRPEVLLRCNYLMRGVFLQPGSHRVEFRFEPPIGFLRLSLAALAGAVIMWGLWIRRTRMAHRVEPVRRNGFDVSP